MKTTSENIRYCVVACRNASGEPDFFACAIRASLIAFEDGLHYDRAAQAAKDEGYEGPYVVFDEFDKPWLMKQFNWNGVSIFPVE